MPVHAYFTSTKLWSVQQSFYDPTLLNDREALRKIVPNDAKCIMINDYSGYIFPYLIDKLGYVFEKFLSENLDKVMENVYKRLAPKINS